MNKRQLIANASLFATICATIALGGCSPSSHQSGTISPVLRLSGAAAQLVANDNDPSDPRLRALLFPMVPPDYQTQIVDIGLQYTMSLQSGQCSQSQFERALLARAIVGFTFYAARHADHYATSKGVAAGFYEFYGKKSTDAHGNMKEVLVVHRILLTMIDKKKLKNVVSNFGAGGVVSNGDVMSDPECTQGATGAFTDYPNEWGGYMAYPSSELAPFLKVYRSNHGKILWNKKGFVGVSL